MVAARANWKGFIKFGELAFSVALYTAASSSERIAFNTLNRVSRGSTPIPTTTTSFCFSRRRRGLRQLCQQEFPR